LTKSISSILQSKASASAVMLFPKKEGIDTIWDSDPGVEVRLPPPKS
jgi:hypothetical protein